MALAPLALTPTTRVAGEAGRRSATLQRLQRAADEALETATNVAALAIAGYLPADRLP